MFASRFSTACTFFLAACVCLVASARAASLPGGAGALIETYQDWVVACQNADNLTSCTMRQVQTNNTTAQHVLTAEFRGEQGGTLVGALLLPFGLALAEGVSLKIDEAAGPRFAFSTCLPTGCIAPISFDAAQTGKLKSGNALNITAQAFSPAQPIAFKVSLKGFTAALNRMAELTK